MNETYAAMFLQKAIIDREEDNIRVNLADQFRDEALDELDTMLDECTTLYEAVCHIMIFLTFHYRFHYILVHDFRSCRYIILGLYAKNVQSYCLSYHFILTKIASKTYYYIFKY